jgi:hypothetical protein
MALGDDIKNQIIEQAETLARTLLGRFVNQALQDGNAFLKQTENDIATWLQDLKQGDITQKNFDSLVRGEKDLAQMEALNRLPSILSLMDSFKS